MPWSTDVRISGIPSVAVTLSWKLCTLIPIWPWSWYIANSDVGTSPLLSAVENRVRRKRTGWHTMFCSTGVPDFLRDLVDLLPAKQATVAAVRIQRGDRYDAAGPIRQAVSESWHMRSLSSTFAAGHEPSRFDQRLVRGQMHDRADPKASSASSRWPSRQGVSRTRISGWHDVATRSRPACMRLLVHRGTCIIAAPFLDPMVARAQRSSAADATLCLQAAVTVPIYKSVAWGTLTSTSSQFSGTDRTVWSVNTVQRPRWSVATHSRQRVRRRHSTP